MTFLSPKQRSDSGNARSNWYPYYAGFSRPFVESALQFVIKSRNGEPIRSVFDPWAGSGTTLCVASELGINAVGFDLNPAMVVVAKARCLSKREKTSLMPLACEIIKSTQQTNTYDNASSEPLLDWFIPTSSHYLRELARSISQILIDKELQSDPLKCVTRYSDLACFYYVAMFRAVRNLASIERCTNPTWVKSVKREHRFRPTKEKIHAAFLHEVSELIQSLDNAPSDLSDLTGCVDVSTNNSQIMPDHFATVDAIVTSPPYCTRIDYVILTALELSILGITKPEQNKLRKEMIGSPLSTPGLSPRNEWGAECNSFLEKVKSHPSKASSGYYFNFHLNYYDRLFSSLENLEGVLSHDGHCVVVVQDSWYKGMRNDLAKIVGEMFLGLGLNMCVREDFCKTQNLTSTNPRARKWGSSTSPPIESVLAFNRNKQ